MAHDKKAIKKEAARPSKDNATSLCTATTKGKLHKYFIIFSVSFQGGG